MSEVSRSFLSTYDFSAFEYHSTLLLDIRCNWKVFVDGFLECYHCPRLHPLFAREYDLTRYRTENGARYSLHTCPRKSNTTTTTTTTPPSDNVLGTADGLWYWIYPNTCLSLYEKYYDTIQVLPMGPLRTRLLVTFYGRKDLPRDQVDEAIKAVSRQTFQEDVDACERVQRVLESGGPYVSGPLHPQKEAAVILFQSLVRQAVEEGAKKKRSEGRPLGDVQRCCVDIEDLGSRC
jgi:phenylpropionate dioxygenase-like ring-hydroxylating dioxygenase large terminal subunit